jgi:hypothetical protein
MYFDIKIPSSDLHYKKLNITGTDASEHAYIPVEW